MRRKYAIRLLLGPMVCLRRSDDRERRIMAWTYSKR